VPIVESLETRIAPATQLVSVVPGSNPPAPGGGQSGRFSLSADGRFAAYTSGQVLVRNIQAGTTIVGSTNQNGDLANGESGNPSLSADGRYLAFDSLANNLVSGDINATRDVFVKDLLTGAIVRASTPISGANANSISEAPSISADGRYVAFKSFANNLIASDTNGNIADIFVKDLQTGEVVCASTTGSGAQGNHYSDVPSISADGRSVAFESFASDLYALDFNGRWDIFVKDLDSGALVCVSTTTGGVTGNNSSINADLSGDGQIVAFRSLANDLVAGDVNAQTDIFVRDLQGGGIILVSSSSAGVQGNGESDYPTISYDGSMVAFQSAADNLVLGDNNVARDVFVKDVLIGSIIRISTASDGTEGNGLSGLASTSADGQSVTFVSVATNLVPNYNGNSDVYRWTSQEAPDLLATDDSGASNSDNVTNQTTLTFTGTAVADTTVKLYSNGNLVGSTTATGGIWSIEVTLAAGTHLMTATVTDGGVESSPSAGLTVIVDTSVSSPVVANPSATAGTLKATFNIAGTAEANALVQVYRDVNNNNQIDVGTDLVVGSQQLAGGGTAYAINVPLQMGINNFLVTATDVAGNVSPEADVFRITRRPNTSDFNGDDHLDILWHSPGAGVIITLLNGTTPTSVSYVYQGTITSDWQIRGVADFDGDGDLDLLWHSPNSGVVIWKMDGTTLVSSTYVFQGATYDWQIRNVSDFDGDGDLDLLWHSPSSGVFIRKLDGMTLDALVPVFQGATYDWQIRSVSDFDGDGDLDLLWHSSSSGVFIRKLDGMALGALVSVFQGATYDWQIRSVSDFDGDGDLDLLWHSPSSGVFVRKLDGMALGALVPVFQGALPANFQVATVGDYNRDGYYDIVWQSPDIGVRVWKLSPTLVFELTIAVLQGPIDPSWRIVA